jgi:uncharacterized protein YndB with AHSA1/START domain
MQKLHFSIAINAPKKKVWDTMLSDQTYPEWTSAFSKGSYFEGSWDKGSKISFVAPDENGKLSGMVSQIEENRPYNFLSIKHLGVVEDRVEDTTSEAAKGWTGALENYTFEESNGGTELLVDMDSDEEYVSMFERLWPQALQKLKELSERQ